MTLPDMNGGVAFIDGEVFTAAHVNSARVSITRALDGVAGGVYTPTPKLEIAGDGLEVSGAFEASGAATISGTKTISGTTTLTLDAGSTVALSPARTGSRVPSHPRVNTTTGAVTYRGNVTLLTAETGDQGIDVDIGQTVTDISVRINASTGAALPTQRAVISFNSKSLTGDTVVESRTDPLNALGTYRTDHTLSMTLTTPHVVVAGESYYISVVGESGANAETITWAGSNFTASKASLNLDS